MKNINTAIRLIAVHLGLTAGIALGADGPAAVLHPPAGVNLEFIGQGRITSYNVCYTKLLRK